MQCKLIELIPGQKKKENLKSTECYMHVNKAGEPTSQNVIIETTKVCLFVRLNYYII